jgi:cob(I)alamin adenosyltransferase
MVDFEIRTDSLATQLGLAASLTKDIPMVHRDLMTLLPLVYHLNGSVRGRLAITEENLVSVSDLYDVYVDEVKERMATFVLPQGVTAACVLHACRSEAKKAVRALHKVSLEKEVPRILFDFTHLLANLLFVMAVYVNKWYGVDEIPFISKSYPVKSAKS